MRTFGTMRLHRRLSARHRGELVPRLRRISITPGYYFATRGQLGAALGGERCYRTGDAIRLVYPADPAQA